MPIAIVFVMLMREVLEKRGAKFPLRYYDNTFLNWMKHRNTLPAPLQKANEIFTNNQR